MSLGTMLKEARKKAGLTQEAAANALYISRQTLSKWETDLSEPKASELLHCLELYHLPVTALLELRPELSGADVPVEAAEKLEKPLQAAVAPKPRRAKPSRTRSRRRRDPLAYALAAACFAILFLSAALFSDRLLPRPGTPLSPDPVTSIAPIASQDAFIAQVERTLDRDLFGGIYLEDGKVVVAVTCAPGSVNLPPVSPDIQVEIRQVQYSYDEMRTVQDYIADYILDAGPESGLRGVGVRVRENRLVVEYGADTGYNPSRLLWLVEQQFGDVPFLQFEAMDGILVATV